MNRKITHPPANPDACGQQRFNMKGSPVFYAASSAHTAIEEKLGKEGNGKSFYISTWEFIQDVPMSYIFLFYKTHFDDPNFKDASDAIEKKAEYLFTMYSEDKRQSLKYYFEQLTRLALSEPFNNITSAIGHYYFHEALPISNYPFGFIAYPSIRKKRDGINYAVHPDLIKNKILVCTGVTKQRLNSHAIEGSNISLEEIGNLKEDASVSWKKFGYNVESALFLDPQENVLLNFDGEALEKNYFDSPKDEESISAKEMIYAGSKDVILSELLSLSKKNEQDVSKEYKFKVDHTLIINDQHCKEIYLKMNFKFYNS